jgi:hypothetical protein
MTKGIFFEDDSGSYDYVFVAIGNLQPQWKVTLMPGVPSTGFKSCTRVAILFWLIRTTLVIR